MDAEESRIGVRLNDEIGVRTSHRRLIRAVAPPERPTISRVWSGILAHRV